MVTDGFETTRHLIIDVWLIFPASTILSLALASVSFHLVERPFIRLGGFLLPSFHRAERSSDRAKATDVVLESLDLNLQPAPAIGGLVEIFAAIHRLVRFLEAAAGSGLEGHLLLLGLEATRARGIGAVSAS